MLYVSMTNPLQFAVSEKSGVKDIYGLEGKIVTPGMLGGTAEQAGMEIFRLLGVHPKLRHMSYADAIEAMKNPKFSGIVNQKVKYVASTDGNIIHKLTNTNELLGNVPGVLGVKTGYTENAMENLVTYLERDGHRIMITVL